MSVTPEARQKRAMYSVMAGFGLGVMIVGMFIFDSRWIGAGLSLAVVFAIILWIHESNRRRGLYDLPKSPSEAEN